MSAINFELKPVLMLILGLTSLSVQISGHAMGNPYYYMLRHVPQHDNVKT